MILIDIATTPRRAPHRLDASHGGWFTPPVPERDFPAGIALG
jgi:hypothetical protein